MHACLHVCIHMSINVCIRVNIHVTYTYMRMFTVFIYNSRFLQSQALCVRGALYIDSGWSTTQLHHRKMRHCAAWAMEDAKSGPRRLGSTYAVVAKPLSC